MYETLLLSLFFFFKQIFYPVSAADTCRDIGLQSLVRKGFFDQKRKDILKTVIRYGN